jgi:hypothetical protein
MCMNWKSTIYLLMFLFGFSSNFAEEYRQIIKENIRKAQAGDWIVTAFDNNYTLLLVTNHQPQQIFFEEITVPLKKLPGSFTSWKNWVTQGAPGHTSWVSYALDLDQGKMEGAYSYVRGSYITIQAGEAFLSNLFRLFFKKVPALERKRIGPRQCIGSEMDPRSIWNPRLIFEGKPQTNVLFDAWKTRWPQDGSELSGKTIEIYLPLEGSTRIDYFPYWLQVSGWIGKAKIRVIDSGTDLVSPKLVR